MQLSGSHDKNEGWRYVKLPQTVYLISPRGDNFYFGYADPRFKFLTEAPPRYSFHEICTYSFLGCGEFKKVSEGIWTNNKFQIPLAVLDMLIEYSGTKRQEIFTIWKNLYARDPELVRKISNIRNIQAFTEDGMYLYSPNISDELSQEINNHQGLFIFRTRKEIPKFEELLEKNALQNTKALRNALMPVLLKRNTFNPRVFSWCCLINKLFNQDVVVWFLREHPDTFTSSLTFPDDYEEGVVLDTIKFLKGFGKVFLKKLLIESPGEVQELITCFKNSRDNGKFFEKFSLDKKSADKPYFFSYLKRYKIPVSAIPLILESKLGFSELNVSFDFGVPRVLHKVDEFEFIVPETRFELLAWGYKLKNCIRNMEDSKFDKNRFIVGIFEKGDLIGACYVNDMYSVSSFLRAFNTQFEKEIGDRLIKSLTKKIRSLNSVQEFVEQNKETITRAMSNYKESIENSLSSLDTDFLALKSLIAECKTVTKTNLSESKIIDFFRESLNTDSQSAT